MSEFVTVARAGEIPPGRGKTCRAGAREIALFFVDGQYYALDDYCPHMGASLGQGEVRDHQVFCDRHRFAFDLGDGSSPDVPTLRAQTFEVRVEGHQIQVRLP
jgi:nitrite reductase (NADH) small subunit/3-phenylpropionate/trans-cinnamate dioxygenase ferredoxin subunit